VNTLVGIKTCDSVRKARKWLDANGVQYTYHDLREDGLDKAALEAWVSSLGWEVLLNKRSTTWKQLSDDDRKDLDEAKVIMLLLAHPTLIKRPVLITKSGIMVGFKEKEYAKSFS
jgi:Spx/MgsR family transcriptional regulator